MKARGRGAGVAAAVDGERLWRRHMEMAKLGATGRGGVDRQALGAAEAEARALLAGWAQARGFAVEVDAIGNLFVRRPGTDPDLAPVVAGSHLDSQPTGGNFDGVYGVLAGFEALEAMDEAGIETRRSIDVAAWTNEEGARFQPGTMGSGVFAGALDLESVLDARDGGGVSVRDALDGALAATPAAGRRPLGFPVAAYLEAHIEQGPVLEAQGKPIGIVTGIQGLRWFSVEVGGQTAHAGTTPIKARRDALSAAVAMVGALEALMHDPTDIVRFTVGRFETAPNSPNTVPNRVFFTVDFRHPEAGVLVRLGDRVAVVCEEHRGPCEVVVTETIHSTPTTFDARIVDTVRATAGRLGLSHMDIVSGATHDAKFLADVCPAGMIFVPCAGGISHSEDESAEAKDLAAGARVLAEALVDLANRSG